MKYLVVLVVDDPDKCDPILDAWEEAGVTGITILESTGLGRLRGYAMRDDLPLMPSLHDLLRGKEVHHRTLLSVVDSEEKVDQMVASVQAIIGSLDEPHTGFLFVVPVIKAYGLGVNLNA